MTKIKSLFYNIILIITIIESPNHFNQSISAASSASSIRTATWIRLRASDLDEPQETYLGRWIMDAAILALFVKSV